MDLQVVTEIYPASPASHGSLLVHERGARMNDLSAFRERRVTSFVELRQYYEALKPLAQQNKFIFRGQKAAHPLATSLERACKRIDGDLTKAKKREEAISREFKRRFHHYAQHVPSDRNPLEWLALMQHHGAPTRLLDWTYSFYVAAYFAVEHSIEAYSVTDAEPEAALWVMNSTWCVEEAIHQLQLQDKSLNAALVRRTLTTADDEEEVAPAFLPHPGVTFVCVVTPFKLNERLTIQKGVFASVGDVTKSFEDNLRALDGYDREQNLVKLKIPYGELNEIREELYNMNITRATLFPGLDGFAQSLKMNLASLPLLP